MTGKKGLGILQSSCNNEPIPAFAWWEWRKPRIPVSQVAGILPDAKAALTPW